MTKTAATFGVVALVVAGLPVSVRGQAAAEYGISASRSAAIGSKARPDLSRTAKTLSNRIQKNTPDAHRQVMEQNRAALEKKSGPAGATVHVESVPDKALISVDGVEVGYAPADLRIPAGAHTLEAGFPGHLPWRQEIAVISGMSVNTKAALASKYKSTINLSFQ